MMHPDRDFLVVYKSSKMNQPNEWIKYKVVQAMEHLVKYKRAKKGPTVCVS